MICILSSIKQFEICVIKKGCLIGIQAPKTANAVKLGRVFQLMQSRATREGDPWLSFSIVIYERWAINLVLQENLLNCNFD